MTKLLMIDERSAWQRGFRQFRQHFISRQIDERGAVQLADCALFLFLLSLISLRQRAERFSTRNDPDKGEKRR
jgi:hypothetical protein